MNIKKTIAKWLNITEADAVREEYSYPNKFGESRSVEYEMEGMSKVFCKVTPWSNGEGFDISFDTEVRDKNWENKKISLHDDELLTMMYCLQDLKYFQ